MDRNSDGGMLRDAIAPDILVGPAETGTGQPVDLALVAAATIEAELRDRFKGVAGADGTVPADFAHNAAQIRQRLRRSQHEGDRINLACALAWLGYARLADQEPDAARAYWLEAVETLKSATASSQFGATANALAATLREWLSSIP